MSAREYKQDFAKSMGSSHKRMLSPESELENESYYIHKDGRFESPSKNKENVMLNINQKVNLYKNLV